MSVFISFVVPAYNERKYIDACLLSIRNGSDKYGVEAEIIVIDNGSTDNTVSLAKKYTDNIISIDRSNVSSARNLGASKATHDVISFIDADIELTSEWFSNLVKIYGKNELNTLHLTGWFYSVRSNGSWIERFWFKNLKDKLLAGGNILTTKTAFNHVGGFNERLDTGEDYDYCARSIEAGVDYCPNQGFKAIHLGFPRDVKNFVRREVWHGQGDFYNLKTFIGSPVALISVFYVLLSISALVLGFCGQLMASVVIVLALATLNLAITKKRFNGCKFHIILFNSPLNFIYFYSRFWSLFPRLKEGINSREK
tara:strand:+ start:3408 stop:4340 length:933 start_codon:yes stop_codon:yes gene_type:complete